ncbi:uncharacterized protein [Rutidosis leptorrhynchoides]|uniref:uncharacterized protein n=1 Tax=Rutidosis leptorrhynchoides TaxID=125765 RepID=UPI003A9924F0
MKYVVSRNRKSNITNQHFFKFDILNAVLDMIIQELGDRFSEVRTELLTNMDALSPRNSFCMFDASKLMRLSEMYPMDFNQAERDLLKHELGIYYDVVHRDPRFANLKGIAELFRLMVETDKHLSYRYVYRLLKLVLVLPVATTTVERYFSTMKLVKSDLRSRMNDEFLNGCLLGVIEREELARVTDEAIMDRFQRMKYRRGQF